MLHHNKIQTIEYKEHKIVNLPTLNKYNKTMSLFTHSLPNQSRWGCNWKSNSSLILQIQLLSKIKK